ncbi:hypothetical protein SAMN05877753_101534 [Bacillus oleivorans]|uniref:Uncharacterized protein n=1 Tax=Bacillus oleivorans TaxID=1448271 RepID=A0A285CJN5_9BACI|nr:hypothetical protein [Bacillus oleivorans]SNX67216.1 hypothetical protein SAMN05877753_101534 [Bacillus oleivorans]
MELFDRIISGERLLVEDREHYEITNIEHTLNNLVSDFEILLHGSTVDIPHHSKLKLNNGYAFATNHAGIAILKAIFSNSYADNLGYPYLLDRGNKLELEILNGQNGVERTKGFVYIISDRRKFKFDTRTSWQYISQYPDVELVGSIEVIRSDFKYPVKYITK